ncbi:cell wall metabolism sensor histidine kinase WalK [Ammoniphilus sp. CFH 90114]|uniref:sensor histidine kinase n=1 Tax=Ammoniphilus sp. CFH 90114 TaxID=2493665 RepID=UPI00100F6C1E|nr:HAMP domain-containing sensor histidine kinase [Ammoniphilus sp. CFH 90114]RXT03713.1 HAMP domain-containing histidine kinase [Ammoniphilus sp. CFH 90114]
MRIVTKLLLIITICFLLSFLFFYLYAIWILTKYLEGGITSPVEHNSIIITGFLLAVGLFILIFIFSIRSSIKYIEYMEENIRKMADENLGSTMIVKGKDELARLASSINGLSLALKQKIEEEREVERLKNELITNISHDLRSPLTTIIGYLRILKDKRYENEKSHDEYVDTAFEKAERLKKLMDDLFAYTKLNHNEVQLHFIDINLKDMMVQFIDEVSVPGENQIVIKSEFPDGSVPIKADPSQLLRVFENLMSNAFKYSVKPGTIQIKLELQNDFAVIEFGNRGNSIPKEDLPRIFERLYKLDKSRSVEDDSSGLGLAISKSIVELHDGQIWAESTDDYIAFKMKLKLSSKKHGGGMLWGRGV